MKNPTLKFLTPAIAALCLGLLPNNAKAGLDYWDPQGTTGANPYTGDMSGTWENSLWSTSSSGSATPTAWVEGDAAVFGVHTGAGTPAYTVTMDSNHEIAGVFDGPLTPDPCTVTITGTGDWQLANAQGFDVTTDGASDPGSVTIDVPIVDGSYASATTGQLVAEGSGVISLNAANTYSGGNFGIGMGGTLLGYSSANWYGTINFNNNQSFGTGSIVAIRGISTAYGTLAAETTGITIANNLDFSQASSSTPYLNLQGSSAASGGTTFSGAVNLGANSVNLGSGGTGNLVTLSGVISGTGSLSKFGASTLTLSGANTYTGATAISAGTLKLGVANAIATSSGLTLAGGTLDPGGFAQSISGPLTLSASSTIDFEAGGSVITFGNSSGATWTSGDPLDLANWNATLDSIQFGTDDTGLTAAQLAEIEFNGNAGTLGEAQLNSDGDLVQVVPEPTTLTLAALGGFGVFFMRRRKA